MRVNGQSRTEDTEFAVAGFKRKQVRPLLLELSREWVGGGVADREFVSRIAVQGRVESQVCLVLAPGGGLNGAFVTNRQG
jgi:hypothetical protein